MVVVVVFTGEKRGGSAQHAIRARRSRLSLFVIQSQVRRRRRWSLLEKSEGDRDDDDLESYGETTLSDKLFQLDFWSRLVVQQSRSLL